MQTTLEQAPTTFGIAPTTLGIDLDVAASIRALSWTHDDLAQNDADSSGKWLRSAVKDMAKTTIDDWNEWKKARR